MNTKHHVRTALLASTLLAVVAWAAPLRAQGLLDQQLGTPPAAPAPAKDPAKPAPDAAPKPDAVPANPAGHDIISPDAVKKVDDQDLIHNLTHPDEKPPADPVQQQMKDMLGRMDQSKTLLEKKDPGAVTQETQSRILTDLDVLIDYARKQQQSGGGKSQGKPQQDQQKQYSQTQTPGQGQGGNIAAAKDQLPNGGQISGDTDNIHDARAGEWGDLRPTERNLISHGANEEYLSAYKEMVNRYYQGLAELGKTRTH